MFCSLPLALFTGEVALADPFFGGEVVALADPFFGGEAALADPFFGWDKAPRTRQLPPDVRLLGPYVCAAHPQV